jgi:hypothetical protein
LFSSDTGKKGADNAWCHNNLVNKKIILPADSFHKKGNIHEIEGQLPGKTEKLILLGAWRCKSGGGGQTSIPEKTDVYTKNPTHP